VSSGVWIGIAVAIPVGVLTGVLGNLLTPVLKSRYELGLLALKARTELREGRRQAELAALDADIREGRQAAEDNPIGFFAGGLAILCVAFVGLAASAGIAVALLVVAHFTGGTTHSAFVIAAEAVFVLGCGFVVTQAWSGFSVLVKGLVPLDQHATAMFETFGYVTETPAEDE
jgi:hypothetical protein